MHGTLRDLAHTQRLVLPPAPFFTVSPRVTRPLRSRLVGIVNRSMSRYPEFAEYKAKTWRMLPPIW